MSTINLTYIQIENLFKDFADRHFQINDFYFGDLKEIGNSQSFKYPLLAVFPESSLLVKASSGHYNTVNHTFNIMVADVNKTGNENTKDIMNDSQLILMDLISEFDYSEFFRVNGILCETDARLTPFFERLDDLVAGWVINFTIKTPNRITPCVIPATTLDQNMVIGNCCSQGQMPVYNYYTKDEVNSLLTGSTVDLSGYYTTAQTYSKLECDNRFLTGLTFDINNYYNKTEVDILLSGITIDMSAYYTTAQTYTKDECDNKFLTGLTFDINNYYTSAQTYDLISLSEINLTIPASGWTTTAQTFTVPGVTSSNEIYWDAKTLSDSILAGKSNLFCSTQGINTLTFECSTTPSSNINLKINIR